MKILLSVIALVIVMASCSKRNDNNVTPNHEPMLTLSKDPSDPGEQIVKGGTEFGLKNLVFLKFIINAKKALIIKHLPATFAGTVQLNNVEGPIMLLDQTGTPLGSADASSSLIVDFMSNDEGIKIPAGITHIGIVLNMGPTASFNTDDYLSAGITEDNVHSIEAYDSENNRLTVKDLTGSAQGSNIYFTK